jgi:hypothetical protein
MGASAPSVLAGQLAVDRRVEEPAVAKMLEVTKQRHAR